MDNSSYLTVSRDKKMLYSIADEGVVSFRILQNGSLSRVNSANIKGMRGCQISTSPENDYIFVSGYHDGKVTVLRLNPDGSVGHITDGVFHKGLGSVAERNFRPHVSCSRMTPDEKFLMVADLGIDQVKVYRFDGERAALPRWTPVRKSLRSQRPVVCFSSDGKFFYLLHELKNVIDVYSYQTGDRTPQVEKVQTIATTGDDPNKLTAACAIRLSPDENYVFCSNAGDNWVSVYERDTETGMLTLKLSAISGEYAKDMAICRTAAFGGRRPRGKCPFSIWTMRRGLWSWQPEHCAVE